MCLFVSLEMEMENMHRLVLGWCKRYYIFALLKFAVWYWNTFLNVFVLYIILMHISSIMFFLLMTYYLLFILYLF